MTSLPHDDQRLHAAARLYEAAVFGGDTDAADRAEPLLDAVEADLALARGRLLHARFLAAGVEDPRELALFDRAAELYRAVGDERGLGEALFWVGTVHQVVRDDEPTSVPAFEEAERLARACGDDLTLSYVVRHLGFVDAAAGRLDRARARLAESVRLRRQLGFAAGVAAGLLAQAQLEHDLGDRSAAGPLLDEAEQVARGCGAGGILRWIAAARADAGVEPTAGPVYETARLVVRDWRPSDAERMHDMYSRPDVVRFLGAVPTPMASIEAAHARIERGRVRNQEDRDAGLPTGFWAIEVRDTGVVAGTVALVPVDGSRAPDAEVEVAWHLHPDAQGHGFATEAAAGAVARGHAAGIAQILALTDEANVASQAVCRRLGLELRGVSEAYYGKPLMVWVSRRPRAGL